MQLQNSCKYIPLDIPTSIEEEYNNIIYVASFKNNACNYMRYISIIYICSCIPLIFFYGIGLFALLWFPYFYHVYYEDFISRQLVITTDTIFYKRSTPSCFPCSKRNTTEDILDLKDITDVSIGTGWFAKYFKIDCICIETIHKIGEFTCELSFEGAENAYIIKDIILKASLLLEKDIKVTKEHVEFILNGNNHSIDDLLKLNLTKQDKNEYDDSVSQDNTPLLPNNENE